MTRTRTTIRAVLAIALAAYLLLAASAVEQQTPGWPALAVPAAVLLALVTVLILRRRSL